MLDVILVEVARDGLAEPTKSGADIIRRAFEQGLRGTDGFRRASLMIRKFRKARVDVVPHAIPKGGFPRALFSLGADGIAETFE